MNADQPIFVDRKTFLRESGLTRYELRLLVEAGSIPVWRGAGHKLRYYRDTLERLRASSGYLSQNGPNRAESRSTDHV